MAQRFPSRSSCEARRKAIQTFKGRLRAFLLIFQQRRKQIRQERASTLLACFPIEKKGGATNEAGALLHCFPLPIFFPPKKRYLRAPPGIPLAPPLTCALPSLSAMPQSPQARNESQAARRAGLGAKHGGEGSAESVLALFQRAWPPLFSPPLPRARVFHPNQAHFSFGAAPSHSIGFGHLPPRASARTASSQTLPAHPLGSPAACRPTARHAFFFWECMREVLMPSSVVVVCVGVERSTEKFSSDL